MECTHCGSTDGYWDCEYWYCTECGESTCATAYGIDVYGNGRISSEDDGPYIDEDDEDYDEDEDADILDEDY